jgi:anti-sigma-K factor RskA
MKCAQIHANLVAYLLGGLKPEEAAEIRRHLAYCPDCQRELEELRKVDRALEAAPPPADPPSYLKDELLSRVRAEEQSASAEETSTSSEETFSPITRLKNLRIVLPTAAAAAALVALGLVFGFWREDAPVATIQLVPTSQEAAVLHGYWGVAELRPQPSGNQQVELKLNNFEEPKPNSYYELWFVSGKKRISAGSFTSVGRGETRVLLNVPPEARKYQTLIITEQRIDNGPTPGEEVALKGEMP